MLSIHYLKYCTYYMKLRILNISLLETRIVNKEEQVPSVVCCEGYTGDKCDQGMLRWKIQLLFHHIKAISCLFIRLGLIGKVG